MLTSFVEIGEIFDEYTFHQINIQCYDRPTCCEENATQFRASRFIFVVKFLDEKSRMNGFADTFCISPRYDRIVVWNASWFEISKWIFKICE